VKRNLQQALQQTGLVETPAGQSAPAALSNQNQEPAPGMFHTLVPPFEYFTTTNHGHVKPCSTCQARRR
jgi:hypothetical protein